MRVEIYESKSEIARAAAERAAGIIRGAIAGRGEACIVAATGASQFEFLAELTAKPGIEWRGVVFFHLDEYVGIPETHPASFRKYLRERIVERVRPGAFHFIEGDSSDPNAECRRLAGLISARTVDAAFVGIGENGHLAFNDPPADFETEE
ncbi:MAG TPA: 6-phosphogluconolactonase, partial [Pyrinomonadaceae bacterium]|nr:6-phosphogluconolactonase [Pyrinomonadaceae bacterium]